MAVRATVKKNEDSPGKGGSSGRPPRKPGTAGAQKGGKDPEPATPTERYHGWVDEAKKYLNNVKAESKRIAWPTQQQMKAYVAVVLFTLITVTLYLFLCDVFFTKLFAWIIGMINPNAAVQQ